VISLKSKLLSTLTVVLIVTIALSTYATFVSAAPKQTHEKPVLSQKQFNSFKLTATGEAKNAAGETVPVSISIEGNANGKLKTVFHIHTQSGTATINGNDAISAVRGQGIIVNKNGFIHLGQGIVVNKNGFIHLVIMMSSDAYGGRNTLWVLRGTTESLTESNTMLVSLEAPKVILPTNGYPQITDLTLTGTINFFN
jgi:hypothetical protein